MRQLLRRYVEPRPDETVASLASRLAARNATTLRGFCLDMQLPLHEVQDGRIAVTRAIAELSGHDPEDLKASMLTRLGDVESRDWSYRGQHLRTENLSRSCRRVCPLCLAGDLTQGGLRQEELAYARCTWRIRPLRTCAVHGVALVEVDEDVDRYSTYDTVQVYRDLLRCLPEGCGDTVRREPSAFEGHLIHRLDAGAGGVGWLDAKPMWAVINLVERVGMAVLFGRSPNLHRLTDDDWWKVGKEGFESLEGGPEGVRPVLDSLHDTFRFTRTGRNAPGRIYGQLWRWVEKIAVGPEFGDVRDVMREHALSRLPLAAGTDVLGLVIERRRIHSLRSLHVETGRHQVRLRKVLASHGMLPEGHTAVHPNRLTFDAEQVTPFLASVLAPMRTPDVADYLGVSRVQSLVRGGIIIPTPVSGHKTGKHEFARDDVENLMMDLRRDSQPLDAIGSDQVDLIAACRVTARKLVELIVMIRERRLSTIWRLSGGKGLSSVVVSRSELKALTRRPEHGALAIHQVTRRLRVHHAAVNQLINKQVLRSAKLPSPRGGNPTRYVTEADLAEFQNQYVTLTELARTRQMSIRNVKECLITRGIEPALPPEVYRTAFYFRPEG